MQFGLNNSTVRGITQQCLGPGCTKAELKPWKIQNMQIVHKDATTEARSPNFIPHRAFEMWKNEICST